MTMTAMTGTEPTGTAEEPRLRGSQCCRFCGETLETTFVDLGASPLCESYLTRDRLGEMEAFYPLHARVCGHCFLVQLGEFVGAEQIFGEYAYFASYSDSWLEHAERYAGMAIRRFGLGPASSVVEVGSNDGYLLQYFAREGIRVVGVEPAANVAASAEGKGVPTLVEFFGESCARRLVSRGLDADLIVGNNVLAQVPDLNGFVEGIRILLRPRGVATMEFPHLVRLVEGTQFDTIYHEHFSYFSFTTVLRLFAAHGLDVFDVEELPTHGGSLRIYVRHEGNKAPGVSARVKELLERESKLGVTSLDYYAQFGRRVEEAKRSLLGFLIEAKSEGKSVAGYGAPGKGNTLLNYCGIRTDFLDYTVDRNPYKQGRFLPGTRIPIHHPDRISETRPDFVLILPWNFKDEIMAQMSHVREWGGRFVVPIPEATVIP